MTPDPATIRASVLALLVVLSVAAGIVGAADPPTAPEAAADRTTAASLLDAVEYDGDVELALDSSTGSPVDPANVDVWVDGERRSIDVAVDGTDGRVVLTGLDDVGPQQSLVVDVSQSGDLDTGNVSVTVTGRVLRAGGSANLFPGARVAYLATETNVDLDVTREGSFLASRSTGENSRVYVVDTDGQEIGPTYYVNESTGRSTRYVHRNLDLTATVNTTAVSTDGAVGVSVTSRGADRPLAVRLRSADSGDVFATVETRMDGDGEASVALSDLEDVPAGSYEVVVEDHTTGITTTTDQVRVGETSEAEVSFARSVVADQRGDVVDVPVTIDGGTADVVLGGEDVNFEVRLTVEDTDGDGALTVRWSTADSTNATGGVWVAGGAVEGSVSVVQSVDEPVVAGEYPLSLSVGGTEQDVATAVVESRETDGVTVLTAPRSADGLDDVADVRRVATPTDSAALDARTLDHDWVFVVVSASGLEGYVDDVGDLTGSANGLELSIVETADSAGPNEDPLSVDLSEARLFADGANDTYVVAIDPALSVRDAEPGDEFEVRFVADASEHPVTEDGEEVTATFTAVNGTASVDATGGEVTVPPASDATVSGTSTFAPGTELTVTARREGGTSPFVTDTTVVVGEDGSWTATFDLSEVAEGTSFTLRVDKAGETRTSVDGRVARGDATTTASTATDGGEDGTPTGTGAGGDGTATAADGDGGNTETGPDDGDGATTTDSPGFGAVVAVVALLAAARLARRD